MSIIKFPDENITLYNYINHIESIKHMILYTICLIWLNNYSSDINNHTFIDYFNSDLISEYPELENINYDLSISEYINVHFNLQKINQNNIKQTFKKYINDVRKHNNNEFIIKIIESLQKCINGEYFVCQNNDPIIDDSIVLYYNDSIEYSSYQSYFIANYIFDICNLTTNNNNYNFASNLKIMASCVDNYESKTILYLMSAYLYMLSLSDQ